MAYEIRGTNFWEPLHTSSATTTQLKKTKDHEQGMNVLVRRRVYFKAIHTREINASCQGCVLLRTVTRGQILLLLPKKIPFNKLFFKMWFTFTEQESGRISLIATRKKKINSTNTLKKNSGVVGREVPFRGSRSHIHLHKRQEQMQTGLKLIFSLPC